MEIQIHDTPEIVAQQAAQWIAQQARAALQARNQFLLAVSGGHTPWQMIRALAAESLPWPQICFAQIDERVAPPGHPDRNLTHLQECLHTNGETIPAQIAPMKVELPDLEVARADYEARLQSLGGSPPVLDVAHLGLGPDGHTASLVPGDPVLDVTDRDVAATGIYQNRRRITLTYPMLNRSRQILWLVTGESKRDMLRRLWTGDTTIPAGRIRREHATILADRDAAASLNV